MRLQQSDAARAACAARAAAVDGCLTLSPHWEGIEQWLSATALHLCAWPACCSTAPVARPRLPISVISLHAACAI